jgi:6-phospho-3-hexuloisomerase
MLTIIGNLRINSLSRLEHLKNSFHSFSGTSDNWLINVRGTFRNEVIDFLKKELGDRLTLFTLLNDNRGWLTNTLEMLQSAKHDYILVWNEDHLNIAEPEVFKNVLQEMNNTKADYLTYSWWMSGKSVDPFNKLSSQIHLQKKKNISVVDLTPAKWKMIRDTGYTYYLISMCGIFRKDFLINMWTTDKKRLPMSFKKGIFKVFGLLTKLHIISSQGHKTKFEKINRVFFRNKIRKYPIQTPFEMEKGPERYDVLPIRYAIPNQELFACIDDNVNELGYSLIERGLYDVGKKNISTKENIESILTEVKTVLSRVDEKQVKRLIEHILSAKKIVASGAGRVGMAVRGFVMRLKHMGLDAYILGDANVPSIRADDLFLVCSGSGETQTIYELTLIAQKNQAQIAAITGNPESRIGKIAHSIVEIKAPSKTKKVENFISIQPMTTLNEQSLSIFFDAVVLKLMEELGETHDTMWLRHSNLE